MAFTANTVEGVTYGTIAGFDCPTFRCTARQATLSVKGCAGLFTAAQSAKGVDADRFAPCRGCVIGAGHAGVPVTYFGHLYDTMICPRCGNGTTRMIHGRICINCYNREREVRVGKNARGSVPKKLKLRPVSLGYAVDGEWRTFHAERAVSLGEVCAHLMRTTAGKLMFSTTGINRITHTMGENGGA
jgi:hypothetical protein